MDPVLPTAAATLTDGFGQRMVGVDSETGEQVELLEFAPQIVEHSGFVKALAERVARFSSVRHASYVHMRRLDRPAADRLQLVSDLTPGWRLSEMLEESAAAGIPIDITIVIGLLRQLLPAVALFSRHNRDASIGALSPHRLIVTPQARLAIAEYAFGTAIEKLNLGRDKLWREYRVSMPPSTGLPRANPRADVNAIGVVALTLLLGRSLELDEFPSRLESLLENAQEHRDGAPTPLSAPFKNWLRRAMQLDPDKSFQSPSESQLSFESVLASDRSYVTTSPALNSWVTEIGGTIDIKRRPAPLPEPPLPAAPEPPPEPVAAAPAQDFDPKLRALLVQSASALAQEQRERELAEQSRQADVAEVEVPLDESPAAAEVAEEAPSTKEAAAVGSRMQIDDDDPIAKQLLTYQPKIDPPKAEPPPPAAPVEEEEDPIARQLRTYQPKPDAPLTRRAPESAVSARTETAEPRRDLTEAVSGRQGSPPPPPEPLPRTEPVLEEAVEEPAAEPVADQYVVQEVTAEGAAPTELAQDVAPAAAGRREAAEEEVAAEEIAPAEADQEEVAREDAAEEEVTEEPIAEEPIAEEPVADELVASPADAEEVAPPEPEPPRRKWWSWTRREPPPPQPEPEPLQAETPLPQLEALPPQPEPEPPPARQYAPPVEEERADEPPEEPPAPTVTPDEAVEEEEPAAAVEAVDEETVPPDEETVSPDEETVPPPTPFAQPAVAREEPLEPVAVTARGGLNPLVLGLGALVLVLLGAMGWLLTRGTGGLTDTVGELVVQSRPEGAQVKIDGQVRGVTPLTIRLDRGAHVLEVQSGQSEPRVIPLMIQGGIQTSQYVELTGTAATGGLEIRSDPPGARIVIDGQNRGTTPMTIRDLSPGEHTVVVELRGRKASRTVRVQAGTTTPLAIPIR